METDERQVTQIGVEDLTNILKDVQFFRVRYFAKKTQRLHWANWNSRWQNEIVGG